MRSFKNYHKEDCIACSSPGVCYSYLSVLPRGGDTGPPHGLLQPESQGGHDRSQRIPRAGREIQCDGCAQDSYQ